jgi:hypothetical protein
LGRPTRALTRASSSARLLPSFGAERHFWIISMSLVYSSLQRINGTITHPDFSFTVLLGAQKRKIFPTYP